MELNNDLSTSGLENSHHIQRTVIVAKVQDSVLANLAYKRNPPSNKDRRMARLAATDDKHKAPYELHAAAERAAHFHDTDYTSRSISQTSLSLCPRRIYTKQFEGGMRSGLSVRCRDSHDTLGHWAASALSASAYPAVRSWSCV